LVQLILAIFLVVVAVVMFIIAATQRKRIKSGNLSNFQKDGARTGALVTTIIGVVSVLIGGFLLLTSMLYFQGVGQARVLVNLDGTVAGQDSDPGAGWKAPWQEAVVFDVFSQQATYAGNGEGVPQYTGGQVNGYEITAPVKGGAQSNFDLSVTYSIDPDKVLDIYEEYRSQERFTAQIINQQILAQSRKVPAAYSPVEFRGSKSGEASDKMAEAIQAKVGPYGVELGPLALQNITYSEQVEESLKAVEVAQQKEEAARAELRATEVSAQAQVVEAEAQAKANDLLDRSLTPEVLESKRLESLVKIGEKGNLVVVPEGTTPFVQVQKQ
jgi:regulator of protease activity HflC (stomatin/prohibitin superfamily)